MPEPTHVRLYVPPNRQQAYKAGRTAGKIKDTDHQMPIAKEQDQLYIELGILVSRFEHIIGEGSIYELLPHRPGEK